MNCEHDRTPRWKILLMVGVILALLTATLLLPDEAAPQQRPWTAVATENEFGDVVQHAAWSDFTDPIARRAGWGRMAIAYYCGSEHITARALRDLGRMPLQHYLWTLEGGARIYRDEAVVRGASGEYRVEIMYSPDHHDIRVMADDAGKLLADIVNGSTIAMSFPTPGLRVAYRWSLAGSTAAIQEACG